jgi:DNA modification methylase
MRVETIGDATLYLGDSREIGIKTFDAVVTDPPYGIDFQYEGYDDSRQNLRDLIAFFVPWATTYAKRSAIMCGITQTHLYPEPDWTACVTWDTTGSFGKCGYTQWMPVLFYGEDVAGFGNVEGAVIKSDVFRVSGGAGVGFARKESIDHPCPKPLNVMAWAVSRFSLRGETVCDPFMGSGTTGVAAVQLGRKFIGIEREPKYFDIACERIEHAHNQGQLFAPAAPKPIQEALC